MNKIKKIFFHIIFLLSIIPILNGIIDLETPRVLGGGIFMALSLFMIHGPLKK